MVSALGWPTIAGHGPDRMWWRKVVFLLLAGINWKCYLLPFLSTEVLSGLSLCRSYACCHGTSACLWVLLCLGFVVSLELSVTLDSYHLLASSSTYIPQPWGGRFDKDIDLWLNAQKSPTFWTFCYFESVLIIIYSRKTLVISVMPLPCDWTHSSYQLLSVVSLAVGLKLCMFLSSFS